MITGPAVTWSSSADAIATVDQAGLGSAVAFGTATIQATAAGVAAQVVADSPEAAKLLAQASDDLRRSLEARDVNLISLEVSTSTGPPIPVLSTLAVAAS